MKHELLALALTITSSACVSEDASDDTTSTVQQGVRGKCNPGMCGLNAAELTNGGFFHEINLDGLANDEGYRLVSLLKDGNQYKMNVVDGRISGSLVFGSTNAPMRISGQSLTGAQIRLKKLVDGEYTYRRITIQSVASVTDYWAQHPDGTPTPKIETYRFWFGTESPPPGQPTIGGYLCHDGAQLLDANEPVRAMPAHHGLVFEGDRINVQTLNFGTVDTRWFNIGCAETALAKLQLNGHTEAAQAVGFTNTRAQRQTFLRMITADYCGTGDSFTANGVSLRWTDNAGTMTIAPWIQKEPEARWDQYGAICLNQPRIEANPTDDSIAKFGYNVNPEIEAVCGTIPTCGDWFPSSIYLRSYNPTN